MPVNFGDNAADRHTITGSIDVAHGTITIGDVVSTGSISLSGSFAAPTRRQKILTSQTMPNPSATSERTSDLLSGAGLTNPFIINYVVVSMTTNGVQSSGAYYISNVASHTSYDIWFSSDLASPGGSEPIGFSLTAPGGSGLEHGVFLGAQRTGLFRMSSGPIGGEGVSPMALYFKITTTVGQPSTAAVISILIDYTTFEGLVDP